MRDLEALAPQSLMALARQGTGLDDFGADHFFEPLSILTRSMREDARLNAHGVAQAARRLTNALENRLRRVALMTAHPEIAEEEVLVGAVILGLPRTGSTMLHRLLTASPQTTGPYWWETVFPLPRGEAGAADIATRKADAADLAAELIAASEGFEAIHPLNAGAIDEELPLIEQSFMSSLPESMMYLPGYGEWLLNADQSPAYDELIEWLKILQWQTPARRGKAWILKVPHHLSAVQTVLDKFPQAAIPMTHRRIEHLMGSWYSMVASLTGGNTDLDFGTEQAKHWTQRWHRNLVAMMAAREKAESRFVDIHYRDLLTNPLAAARKVFQAAGLPVADTDETAWANWLDGNKRDSRPSHKYDVADYGMSSADLTRDFAFYSDRFDKERVL
jgi:hypothetical protein